MVARLFLCMTVLALLPAYELPLGIQPVRAQEHELGQRAVAELGGLEFEWIVDRREILPYQSCRIRAAVTNRNYQAKDVPALVNCRFRLGMLEENAALWDCPLFFSGILPPGDDTTEGFQYERALEALCRPIKLEPHYRHSLSMPVVSRFAWDGYVPDYRPSDRAGNAIFLGPSECGITLSIAKDPMSERAGRIDLKVRCRCVPAMDANDSRIFEELRKNDRVGRFVSNPAAEADFEVALQIRQLLKLPHSSYHDYLKFGLARAIVGSTGRKLPTHRKRLEGNFANLLRYPFEGAQERNCEVLKRYPFQSSRDRSDIEACIVRAVEVTGRRREEDKSVDAAIAELCDLTIASNLDVAEALQALRSIDGRSFPFQPSVLMLRWKIAVSMDAPEANDLRRQLDEKYFDALEWLIDQGMRANSVKWTPTLTRKSEQNEPKP